MTDDPHKQRKAIEENLAQIREQFHTAEVGRYKRESEEQAKNLKHAHIDHARHIIGGADLAVVEGEAADAEQAHTDAVERAEILQAAIGKEERALKKHLAEHFDTFAQDCLRISKKVEENIGKANGYINTVREQRLQLHAKWRPLLEAVKLMTNIPKLEIEPLPVSPLRPPGVDADGKIIRGSDEWGRPLGDVGLNRSERTADLLAQARREQAEAAARQAGIEVPAGADAEAVMDAARALTPAELKEQKEQNKREREANLQAAKG